MKNRNKVLLFFVSLIVVAAILFIPRPITKTGYIIRGMEAIMFEENMVTESHGYLVPAPDSKSAIIVFTDNYNYLYDELKPKTILKVTFKGWYYPVSFPSDLHVPYIPKIVLKELISKSVVQQ